MLSYLVGDGKRDRIHPFAKPREEVEGMTGTPQREQHNRRVIRTLVLIAILTSCSLYLIGRDFFPPHGHPLLYTLAMSWLIAAAAALGSSGIFFRLDPRLFSLAHWEKAGAIYDRTSIRAFRWVLLRSPLGWINPNMHLSAGRTDCDRLLREINTAEGVHWLAGLVSVLVAIAYLVDDYAVYGYSLLLVNIPINLYPILLQRWNRGRVRRVLSRQLRTPG